MLLHKGARPCYARIYILSRSTAVTETLVFTPCRLQTAANSRVNTKFRRLKLQPFELVSSLTIQLQPTQF